MALLPLSMSRRLLVVLGSSKKFGEKVGDLGISEHFIGPR